MGFRAGILQNFLRLSNGQSLCVPLLVMGWSERQLLPLFHFCFRYLVARPAFAELMEITFQFISCSEQYFLHWYPTQLRDTGDADLRKTTARRFNNIILCAGGDGTTHRQHEKLNWIRELKIIMGKLNECSTRTQRVVFWRFVLDTLFCTELGIIKVYSFPTMWTWMLAHAPTGPSSEHRCRARSSAEAAKERKLAESGHWQEREKDLLLPWDTEFTEEPQGCGTCISKRFGICYINFLLVWGWLMIITEKFKMRQNPRI